MGDAPRVKRLTLPVKIYADYGLCQLMLGGRSSGAYFASPAHRVIQLARGESILSETPLQHPGLMKTVIEAVGARLVGNFDTPPANTDLPPTGRGLSLSRPKPA